MKILAAGGQSTIKSIYIESIHLKGWCWGTISHIFTDIFTQKVRTIMQLIVPGGPSAIYHKNIYT